MEGMVDIAALNHMKEYLADKLGFFTHIPVDADGEARLKKMFDELFILDKFHYCCRNADIVVEAFESIGAATNREHRHRVARVAGSGERKASVSSPTYLLMPMARHVLKRCSTILSSFATAPTSTRFMPTSMLSLLRFSVCSTMPPALR